MKIVERLLSQRICSKLGHDYKYDGDTLAGDWIRCTRCNKLEEYLPGVHEPKGYKT